HDPGARLRASASTPSRTPPRLHAAQARHAPGARGIARAGAARELALFRAGSSRMVPAARRRVGSAAPSPRSGDAALLLALRCLLRRLHVLVQRSVRSAGLDLLLGRRHRVRAAAAAVAPFHDGLPAAAEPEPE